MTRHSRLALFLLLTLPSVALAEKWTQPSPEELSMTAQPEVPGAPAIYLFREEITDDKLHMWSVYARIKVLNERGKDFSNIELPYNHRGDGSALSIGDIAGRTIGPDGSVVAFSGKPYDKLIVKNGGNKVMAKVFTLPDVRVGSILEYRYTLRWDDRYYIPPQWYVQSELFTRKAHYLWRPTSQQLISSDERGQLTEGIAWARVLPAGVNVRETDYPSQNSYSPPQTTLELDISNVPPMPSEEYMPPISGFSYRVLFYYSAYRTSDEFWKKEGKYWAHQRDRFIGPGPAVSAAAREFTADAASPEEKLHRLYAAVQKMENTEFTRSHTGAEDKAEGFRAEIKTTDDVLARKRGNGDQLTLLFVGLARAAGFHAYVMAVTDRDRSIFFPAYLSLSQLNDDIAIVNLDGKEIYLDPGSPCVPFGQLAWRHDMSGGLREVDGGADIGMTPGTSYTASRVQRVANLNLAANGLLSGTVKLTYIGAPAVHWRERAVLGDEESLRRELTEQLEGELPAGIEPHLDFVEQLKDVAQPLVVNFHVSGHTGSSTGKRLLLPGEFFESRTAPAFPHEKRDIGVYFEYPHVQQDAIRINFPAGSFAVESIPETAKLQFQKYAVYELKSEATASSVTVRRTYVLGEVIFQPKEYPELRTFYGSFEGKDQQPIVLKPAAVNQAQADAGAGSHD